MKKIYVDCFYYSFWINESELNKYNLNEDILHKKTQLIYENNTIQNIYCNVSNVSNDSNQTNISHASNILTNYLINALNLKDKDKDNNNNNNNNVNNCSNLYYIYLTKQLFSSL